MAEMRLEDEMRTILVRMSLLMYGRTQSFNSSGGKSENPDPRPSGESWTLADHWAGEWRDRPTHETVQGARDELEAWLKRTAPVETDGTAFEDWVIEDGMNYAVAQVAGKFGIPESRVRRIRLKHGRETEFGLVIDHAAEKDRSEERVVYLSGRGCSWREIAAQTGLHKTQVQRILGRHRKAA
jgi:hypothetical protein